MVARKTVPTWLYHKELGGKIHEVVPGSPPPKGWRDTPWPEHEDSEPARKSKIGGALPGRRRHEPEQRQTKE